MHGTGLDTANLASAFLNHILLLYCMQTPPIAENQIHIKIRIIYHNTRKYYITLPVMKANHYHPGQ